MHTSGDPILVCSTAATGLRSVGLVLLEIDEVAVSGASDSLVDDLFAAVIDATEEAIVNALVAARTMVGRFGLTARAVPHDLLRAAL
ncbi:P1 family peptidase [Microbacterium sp. NPDC089696]|uniref:P1 family peptidase n=1 Tax=Microbacterium sp. NPDC089696 TaxID=3364199 RepID=UPI0038014425